MTKHSDTPITGVLTQESSERMARVAADKAELMIALHERDCSRACKLEEWVERHRNGCAGLGKLEERIGEMATTQKEHADFISQYLGEQKFKRFVLPVLVGALGSAAGVGVMGLLFKGLMHSMITGMVKP